MDSKKRQPKAGTSQEHVMSVYKQVVEIKEKQAQTIHRDSGRGHHTSSAQSGKQSA